MGGMEKGTLNSLLAPPKELSPVCYRGTKGLEGFLHRGSHTEARTEALELSVVLETGFCASSMTSIKKGLGGLVPVSSAA